MFLCIFSSNLTNDYRLTHNTGTMHAIVQRTANAAAKKQTSSTSAAKRVSSRELQLINSRDNIIHPPRNFRAMRVSCSIDKS